MDQLDEQHLQTLQSLVENLYTGEREVSSFMRFSDFYNGFLHLFASYVSPYLWIIPLTVTIIIVVTFKRAKLFGVTQKLIVITMTMDMFFTLFTGIKDGLLNFLNMNYGFIEYKICRFFFISFRIQGIIHGTSLLLKSIMTARIVLLFAFPMKFKNYRFTKWTVMLLFIHVIVCALCLSPALMIALSPVTTVQEYKHGEPLKIIQACVVDSYEFFNSYYEILFVVQMVYFLLIPLFFQCVCIIVLSILMKKQIKAVLNMLNDNKQRHVVKYLRLMKVSLLLGISFLIQETPQVVTNLYGFSDDVGSMSKFNSISYVLMVISYAIGKPVDLLIYSYQSEAFRTTLSKMICRIKKR